jgi:D-alanyl-D-alanine carboxypeptidase (penicillin-binding protein 5/6)
MNSQFFFRSLRLITMGAFSILLLSLPGQNQFPVADIAASLPPVPSYDLVLTKDDIPLPANDVEAPQISASGAIIMDIDSATVLYAKNPHQPFLPASTTKIMTALVALAEYQPQEIITIKDEHLSIGNKSDLVSGEQYQVSEVLRALLISSGNDAALALGQHHPGGYNHFVDLMNQTAQSLHLTQTHFQNVSGVEQPDHYISAWDLAILTKYALQNPTFAGIVSTYQTTIKNLDGTITHHLENTNELLGEIPGVTGVKTGWTQNAGECLVTSLSRYGHHVVVVVLDSSDRFGESRALINWLFKHYSWQTFPEDIIPDSLVSTPDPPPAPAP